MTIGQRAYFISPAPALFHVCYPGPAILELFGASHLSDVDYLFLQLHNTIAQPPPGNLPTWELLIGPLAVASYTPSRVERLFPIGVTAALSITAGFYTPPESGAGFICTFEGAQQDP